MKHIKVSEKATDLLSSSRTMTSHSGFDASTTAAEVARTFGQEIKGKTG